MRCATRSPRPRSTPRSPTRRSPPPSKCVAAYHQGAEPVQGARSQGRRADVRRPAARRAKPASNTDLEIKSVVPGRPLVRVHRPARDRRSSATRPPQTVDPKHSYSDDALLREAEEWASLNDGKKVEEVLSALPSEVPDGRQRRRGDVAARLARVARASAYDDAIKWWKKQIRARPARRQLLRRGPGAVLARPRVRREGQAGRRGDRAVGAGASSSTRPRTTRCSRSTGCARPSPKRYEALVAEISTDPAGLRSEGAGVHVQAARRVGRAGLLARDGAAPARARRPPPTPSCSKLGLTAPAGKKRVDDPELDREAVGDGVPLRPRGSLRDRRCGRRAGTSSTTASSGRSARTARAG